MNRTDGGSKGEGDAEPQEAAQQVTAHRSRGACSDGALPVCLGSAETGSEHGCSSAMYRAVGYMNGAAGSQGNCMLRG